ncbi:MAG: UDP-N-acetylmuramoyl-L-alanine--D-glutamate ligase [Actinomycetes bacterium]
MSTPARWYDDARAPGAWSGVRVCVTGIALSGSAAARALATRGATVTVVDGRSGPAEQERAADLARLGVAVALGAADELPPATDLVVTSPGWRPDQPLIAGALAAGVPVWGEVELAWRLRDPAVPWLGVTGTNGKTTTVEMLASILAAGGLRTVAAGNVGLPLIDAVLADPPYDVLAVEVSSFQLHWTRTVEFAAAAVLNVADDHIDWHGSLAAYAADKASVWRGPGVLVVNADDAAARGLAASVAGEGRRIVSFTLDEPGAGQLGVRDGWLVAAPTSRGTGEVRLVEAADVRPPGPHNVANALAAAALARAHGISAEAVRAGLLAFAPGGHRIEQVATVAGIDFVDDSKATNPHAAAASLLSFDHVVWVAGGLAKGARFDELVEAAAGRLRGVVLLGRDRGLIAEALARHAPDVPVVDVAGADTGVMDDVVRAAAALAAPGDTVLLAPACASMDMFRDYAARGDAFAAAVTALGSVA